MSSYKSRVREHHQALLEEDSEHSDGHWKKDRYFDTQSRQNSIHRERKRLFYGYFSGVFGVVILAAALVCSQAMNNSVPIFELNGLRFMAQFFMAAPLLACCSKCHITVDTKYYLWLFFGIFFVIFNGYAKYAAASYLPLGDAVGASHSLTLVFTFLLSCCAKRSVRWFELVASGLSIVGMILITQPYFIFRGVIEAIFGNTIHTLSPCSSQAYLTDTSPVPTASSVEIRLSNTTQDNHLMANSTLTNVTSDNFMHAVPQEVIGYGFCVIEALFCSLHILVVNKRLQGFNPFLYNAVVGFFGLLVCLIIMAFTEQMSFPASGTCWTFLGSYIITAGSFGLFQYASFQMIPPSVSALLITLQIPSAFFMQYTTVAYLNLGYANVVEICGAVLVFLAIAMVPLFEVVAMNKKMDIRKL